MTAPAPYRMTPADVERLKRYMSGNEDGYAWAVPPPLPTLTYPSGPLAHTALAKLLLAKR